MLVKSFASNMIIDLSYNMSKYKSINTFENCLKWFVYVNARLDYTNIIALCRLDVMYSLDIVDRNFCVFWYQPCILDRNFAYSSNNRAFYGPELNL